MNNIFIVTNPQKALNFLTHNPGKQFTAGEIERQAKISRAGVNFALRKLAKENLVIREKRAKIYLYSVDHSNSVVKQAKVLQTAIVLQPLLKRIKKYCQKVILFGSCARGEDIPSSDIDLFVLTTSVEEVKKILAKPVLAKKLQSIIRTPLQFTEMEEKEPVFYEEVVRGVTLWEAKT